MSAKMRIGICAGALALSLGLGARAQAQVVGQNNLVANTPVLSPLSGVDINLVNAWGFARGVDTNYVVSLNGKAIAGVYDGAGNTQNILITVPPAVPGGAGAPTGVVYNGVGANLDGPTGTTNSFFYLPPGGAVPVQAEFIFVTADGTIQAYTPSNDPNNAFIVVNNNGKASYTGVTISEASPGVFHLYAVNFQTGVVEVYDTNFKRVKTLCGCGFENEQGMISLQETSANSGKLVPYNIQAIGPDMVTTFVVENYSKIQFGQGFGLVVISDPQCRALPRIFHSRTLNAPWGIALAPQDFGRLSHTLLIGNTGANATISAFDIFTGRFLTQVLTPGIGGNVPLQIDGLKALGFGANTPAFFASGLANNVYNDVLSAPGPYNNLYFTAGPDGGTNGLIGQLSVVSTDIVLGEQ